MAKVYECIEAKLASFIEAQPLFFVGTAPLAGDGLVNVSPKGTRGTFMVLDAHTFAYLDLTGSGVETVAHLRENGRICVMFCAFDGGPNIVRLHGTGRTVFRDDPAFEQAIAAFGEAGAVRRAQARAVILVDITRVSDSCGYAVPKMALVEERDVLDSWSRNRGPDKLVEYRAIRNTASLDGLPALPA
jgi:Pyridoxamine 5'-phosphate oxidase